MILIWFMCGFMVGMVIAFMIFTLYGDSELNESVRELRKARYDLQMAKTKYRLAHTLHWWKRRSKRL